MSAVMPPYKMSPAEQAIYDAAKTAAEEAIREYMGHNGETHKYHHNTIIPELAEFLKTQKESQNTKNEFWLGVKKDLVRMAIKFLAVLAVGSILVAAGVLKLESFFKLLSGV